MTSRRRLPPTAPSDLWDRPEMARALAERDMGSVVRIFRRWTGASQTDISGLVDMPQSHISDLERGRRQITALEVFERFAEGLSIPRHRLGLAEPTDDQPPQPADAEDEGDTDGRQPPLTTEEAVRASARDAAGFIYEAGQDDHDPVVLEQLQADTSRLALQYSTSAPTDVLGEVRALRLRLLRTLNELQRADKAKDLYLIAGQLSGILAYVDLDLGYPDEAMTNSRMAWLCGEFAGHNGLRAWVRGTQSLIARFQGRYDEAYDLARSGLPYATEGTAAARLASGEAQCLAQFGDSHGTHAALHRADDALDTATSKDALGGLFTFPRAKRYYYAGSSLIWLPGPEDAQAAEAAAEKAIKLWQAAPLEERSLADELLAHVYLATARLNQGEVEGILPALRPVLDAPPELRISWQKKRLARISGVLASRNYRHSPAARSVLDELDASQAVLNADDQ
jgi:Helix-turn-helix domain